MAWPISTPADIFGRAAAVYEAAFPGIDARSANSVASTNCRIIAQTAYDLYLYQGALANELMPDTAVDWLSRHADIWGVPRLQPTAATGFGVAVGVIGKSVPAGALLSAPSGALYLTVSAVTIGSGGTALVPVISAQGGAGYNLPAGTILTFVSPVDGLTVQRLTLDSNGAANGTDLESITAWRARILARIREPAHGGSQSDYETWARNAGAAYAKAVGGAVGAGSVGIYIAAAGPSVASDQLVAAVQSYIGVYGEDGGVRPVTARAVVAAATLVTQDVTLHLNPDTAATRAAATAALQLFFQQDAGIGKPIYVSRLDNAVSSADGEFSHERVTPSADVTCTNSQMIVLGAVTFT